jgi:hypothetical protein
VLLSLPLLAGCVLGQSSTKQKNADRAVCTAWGRYLQDTQAKAASATLADLDAVQAAATAAGHSKISGAATSEVEAIHSFATAHMITERPSPTDARVLATGCSSLGISFSGSQSAR